MLENMIILILFAAVLIFAGKYYQLKRQLKSISRQLCVEHTRLVTVAFADDDVEKVALEINQLLEEIQQAIIKSNASAMSLKTSIADISHDMKTPLTSVIGYLQLAEKECDDEKMGEIIEICLERTRYCNSLINDFFELSLIELQGCTPKIEKVDVAGIICDQILASHPAFEEKNITPKFEDFDKTVFVSADQSMLNRVIQNLISNGIKYTSGDLSFCISEENGRVIITVSNSVDIPVDTTHIFDRFYTEDKSRSRGSGIGLYICRQFVDAMGGSIRAEMDGNCLSIKVILHSASGVPI
ncbi:MAG: HAMP domain-containing histidine kinase [Lachnospiraceae bacterium]|nr:HAMP domain-containing histidine kinase [Lachnospiraceae bacterium]